MEFELMDDTRVLAILLTDFFFVILYKFKRQLKVVFLGIFNIFKVQIPPLPTIELQKIKTPMKTLGLYFFFFLVNREIALN